MAKIARRRHERLSKERGPQAIDDHARGERVVAAADGEREFLAAAALVEDRGLVFGENAQEAARRFRAFAIYIAADEHVEVFHIAVLDHVDGGRIHFVGVRFLALIVTVRLFVDHARAGENAGEAVVVALSDGLEFVVVTARASDG